MRIPCSIITSRRLGRARDMLPRYKKASGTFGEHFGDSPHFTLVEVNMRGMKHNKQEIMANPFKDLANGKGQKSPNFS
jgi:predicted Fe-Mo cluster-binding NifX family protein